MLIICLLLFLNRLVVQQDTVRSRNVFFLKTSGFFDHFFHCLLMLHICVTELFTHRLIQICRIIGIICLCIFQLCKCLSKICELYFKRCVHLFQKSIQNFFNCIFLTFRHRRDQCIQRVIHLFERRSNDFFKTVCHFYRKLFCHLVHGSSLILLTCNQKIHGFCLCTWHHICMEFIQKQLKILCKSGIFALHSRSINNRKCNTIDRSKERNLNTIYQRRN